MLAWPVINNGPIMKAWEKVGGYGDIWREEERKRKIGWREMKRDEGKGKFDGEYNDIQYLIHDTIK